MNAASTANPALTPLDSFMATVPEAALVASRRDTFAELGGKTGLRVTASGDFYLSNLQRGHLLYALVRHLRPKTILEIGTGRGYGALSMAMAAADAGLDTEIFTIDQLAPDAPQSWPIVTESGPRVVNTSIRDVWASFPAEWTERVRFLTGKSTDALHRWMRSPSAPAVDFAFIDGGHDYWTVRHDVVASITAAREGEIALLLDDYGGVQGKAVRAFVDTLVAPLAEPDTLTRIEMPQTESERLDNGEHGMVFISAVNGAIVRRLLFPSPPIAVGYQRIAAILEDRLLAARASAGAMRRSIIGRGGGR